MIHLAKSGNRFDLYFQNTLFFSHRNDEPAVILGKSTPKLKFKAGIFNISEKIQKKIPMNRFSVEQNTQNRVVFLFSNSDTYESLRVEFLAEESLTVKMEMDKVKTEINRVWIHLPSHIDENVFGAGQQFGRVCLNNQTVPLFVDNRAEYIISRKKSKDFANITSFPMPIFMAISSDTCYLCHIDTYLYGEFSFHRAGKKGQFHELYFWGFPDKIFIQKGDSPLTILTHLTSMLGKQPSLPTGVVGGIWLSGSTDTEKLYHRMEKLSEEGITVSSIWFPDWAGVQTSKSQPLLVWDWKWNGSNRPIRYPEFPKLVTNLKQNNVGVFGYINGFLSRNGDLYQEVPKNQSKGQNILVKTKFDTEFVLTHGNQDHALLELSRPETRDWFAESLKRELQSEIGFTGTYCGETELFPLESLVFKENEPMEQSDPFEIHNQYPGLLAQTCQELNISMSSKGSSKSSSKTSKKAQQTPPKENPFLIISPAGHQNSLSYTSLVSTGPLEPTWDYSRGLGAAISAAISAGCSGIGYHHSIIGGWGTNLIPKRPKELFIRWAEFAAFSLVMHFEGGFPPAEWWHLDSDWETYRYCVRLMRIHTAIKPYLEECVEEYQYHGWPVIRAPVLHYPTDPHLFNLVDQYLLGKDLWVAPIVKENTEQRQLYLPEDGWVHLWSGIEFTKGNIKISVPLGYPAVFYRKGCKHESLFDEITHQFGTHA